MFAVETKLWLYSTCILPVFLCGSEIWYLTSTLEKKIHALDNWFLRCIFHIHWRDFVSNDVVRSHTGQLLLSDTICQQRLSFGHLCHADIGQDHSRALRACIQGPPKDWHRRTGRLRQTWLRMVEDDLRTQHNHIDNDWISTAVWEGMLRFMLCCYSGWLTAQLLFHCILESLPTQEHWVVCRNTAWALTIEFVR